MDKFTISMAIFNSYLYVYQRVRRCYIYSVALFRCRAEAPSMQPVGSRDTKAFNTEPSRCAAVQGGELQGFMVDISN